MDLTEALEIVIDMANELGTEAAEIGVLHEEQLRRNEAMEIVVAYWRSLKEANTCA